MVPRSLAALVLIGACASGAVADETDPSPGGSAAAPGPVDAERFFEDLAGRYRRLEAYEDEVEVVETVAGADDARPHQVESRLECRLAGDRLEVVTAGAQVRGGAGLDVPIEKSPAMEALVRRWNLWQAPHLALHFADDPARFRLGVQGALSPQSAERLVEEGRGVVHLVLEEEQPDSGTEAPGAEPARFEFWVEPESMLIRRLTGRQVLPDGSDYRTALRITPTLVGDAAAGDTAGVG